MSEITTAEVLKRIDDSLNATNVLSDDYKRHIQSWVYKLAEVAYDAGRKSVTNDN